MSTNNLKIHTKSGIEKSVNEFFKRYSKNRLDRFASFDYCYNYFYSNRKTPRNLKLKKNLEKSCLHLGFFLASWGMYRGSTAVPRYNARLYEDLIKNVIAEQKSEIWDIDVNNYNKYNIEKLVKLKKEIENELRKKELKIKRKGTEVLQDDLTTLSTKIMLGVFGNTPAFDTNIRNVINRCNKDKYDKALEDVKNIYDINPAYFDRQRKRKRTFDFKNNGRKYHYTIAKLVDMYAWQKYDKRLKNKK